MLGGQVEADVETCGAWPLASHPKQRHARDLTSRS
jgi:hypothetical protein